MLFDESAIVDILYRTSQMEREGDKDRWPRLGMLSQLNNVYENPQLPIEQLSGISQLPIEPYLTIRSQLNNFLKFRSSQLGAADLLKRYSIGTTYPDAVKDLCRPHVPFVRCDKGCQQLQIHQL